MNRVVKPDIQQTANDGDARLRYNQVSFLSWLQTVSIILRTRTLNYAGKVRAAPAWRSRSLYFVVFSWQ